MGKKGEKIEVGKKKKKKNRRAKQAERYFGEGKGCHHPFSFSRPSLGLLRSCLFPNAEPGRSLVQYRTHAQDDRHDPIWHGYKQEKIYL